MHIPKTGGTAVRALLAPFSTEPAWAETGPTEGLGTGPYFDQSMIEGVRVAELPEPRRRQFVTRRQLRELCAASTLLMGHYSAQRLLDAGCVQLATLVREPRARLASLYRYWESVADDELAAWGPWGAAAISAARHPLRRFLVAPGAWPATHNAMACQLLLRSAGRRSERSERLIARALGGRPYQRLCLHLVIAEWSGSSVRFVQRVSSLVTGTSQPEPVADRVNETLVAGEPQDLDAACRDLLDERTALDRLVLDHLARDGFVPRRSPADLDDEFETTAAKLGFRLT